MRRWVVVLLLAAGCGDDDSGSRAQGELGGLCYPNGTCNVTLTCQSGLCVAIDGGTPGDASVGDGALADAFVCANDSVLEPNETTQSAWVTPVDTTKSFPLSALAICPAGDVDVYSLMITTAGENIEFLVNYQGTSPGLLGDILNSGGIAIANATPTGTPRQLRAYTPNMPTGIYYVRVSGSTGAVDNYSMTINITGP